MKKLVLIFSLVLSLGLCACGGKTATIQEAAIPAETAVPTMPGTVPSIPEEEQKRILENNRNLWAFTEVYESPWFYTFTDLDRNGQLEVIAASTQGTGIFTYVNYYEVLADGSGLRNLYHADAEIEGPDDWPEIVLDTLPCYYDAASDRYFYPCEGVTHDGYAHQYYAWHALCLKDGAAEWELLAYKNMNWDSSGALTTDCYDAQGNPITETDYDSAVERRFAGMQKSEVTLNWTQVEIVPYEEADESNGQDDAEAYGSVIDKYRAAYESGNSQNAEYAWTNGLSEIMAYSSGVGYALRDLDQNGIPELIIMGIETEEFSERMVYGLYTLENGVPVNVATSQVRMRYYIRSDNTLLYEGSGGASYTYITVQRLRGSTLEDVEMVFTNMEQDASGQYYTSYYYQQGHSETLPGEKSAAISENEFVSRLQQMESSIDVPPLTPIY